MDTGNSKNGFFKDSWLSQNDSVGQGFGQVWLVCRFGSDSKYFIAPAHEGTAKLFLYRLFCFCEFLVYQILKVKLIENRSFVLTKLLAEHIALLPIANVTSKIGIWTSLTCMKVRFWLNPFLLLLPMLPQKMWLSSLG